MMACQISINFVQRMLGADWAQGKSWMKFELRNMSIGYCRSAEACEVECEQGDEREIFKFGSKKLPYAEA